MAARLYVLCMLYAKNFEIKYSYSEAEGEVMAM